MNLERRSSWLYWNDPIKLLEAMMRTMLKGKIHRARVTHANVDYEGSISIDKTLMEAADILPYGLVRPQPGSR